MKKLLILCAILLLSNSVYAYEASVGVKVSPPHITNHGFKDFHIEESAKKSKMMPVVGTMVMTSDQEGRPGEDIKVSAWHDVAISNYTNQTKHYTYRYNLNCDQMSATYSRDVDLPPNTNFHDSSYTYGVVQEDSEGSFRISAATQVTGDETSFHDAYAVLRVRD